MGEEPTILKKATKTVLKVAKDAGTGIEEKSLLDQMDEVGGILEHAEKYMNNPIFKKVLESAKEQVEKVFQKRVGEGQQSGQAEFSVSQAEIESQKVAPVQYQTPQGKEASDNMKTQIVAEKRIAPIVPTSEIHAKLITVMNEIPESNIHDFLRKYVGSERIEVIREKVKPFIS